MRIALSTLLLAACTAPNPFGTPATLATPTGDTGATEVVDVFPVAVPQVVDVLLVVDPTLQSAVADDLPFFLDSFVGSGRDYHIGLVSSALGDPSAGVMSGWVDAATPNPVATLLGTALPTTAPLGPMGASYLALTGNPGFLRAGAAVHVVAFAAGPDDSATVIDEASWRTWFEGLGDVGFSSYAPAGSTLLEGLAASYGVAIDDATPLGNAMDRFGVEATGLQQSFALSVAPDPTSIEVEVHDGAVAYRFEEGTDWTFDAATNTVTFTQFVPSVGSEVHVRYVAAP